MDAYSARDVLRMVFRRRWFLIVPVFAGLVAGVLLLGPFRGVFPPRYTATAHVIRRDSSLLRAAPRGTVAPDIPAVDVSFFRAEILTWPLLDTVIRRTNLDAEARGPADLERVRRRLRNAIKIDFAARPARGATEQLIAISMTDGDPEVAKDVANAVANAYKDSSQHRRRGHVDSALGFLRRQEEQYRQELQEVELELARYRQEQYEDLPEVRSGIQRRLLDLRIQKATLERQLDETEESLQEVEEQLEELPEIVTGETSSERNPEYDDLENRIRERERALRMMLTRYTERHPDVLSMKSDIEALKEQLAETPRRLEGVEKEILNPVRQERMSERLSILQSIRSHRASLTAVMAQIEASKSELREVSAEETRYNELLRRRNEYASRYQEWRDSSKRQQTTLEASSEEYGREVEILAEAIAPTIPDRINMMAVLIACIGAGVTLGAGSVLGLEYVDHSFRDRDDAARYLDVPVLGSIMTIKRPGMSRARRRRRLRLAAGLGAMLLVTVVAVFLWEQFRPGAPGEFLHRTQSVLGRFMQNLQG